MLTRRYNRAVFIDTLRTDRKDSLRKFLKEWQQMSVEQRVRIKYEMRRVLRERLKPI